MNEKNGNMGERFANLVSSVGESQGDAALKKNCFWLLHEPKIPQALLEEKEK